MVYAFVVCFVLTLAHARTLMYIDNSFNLTQTKEIMFVSFDLDLARFVCVRNKVSACVPVRGAVVLADGAL